MSHRPLKQNFIMPNHEIIRIAKYALKTGLVSLINAETPLFYKRIDFGVFPDVQSFNITLQDILSYVDYFGKKNATLVSIMPSFDTQSTFNCTIHYNFGETEMALQTHMSSLINTYQCLTSSINVLNPHNLVSLFDNTTTANPQALFIDSNNPLLSLDSIDFGNLSRDFTDTDHLYITIIYVLSDA